MASVTVDRSRVAVKHSKPVSTPKARETFEHFLKLKGLRVTEQRRAIFETAISQKEHFTADVLLERVRALAKGKYVSRATVYRTLPVMTESSLLREVDIGSGEKFYTPHIGNNSQIAQVVCMDCDKIFEISAPFMDWYGSTVSSKLGLTPVAQRLQVSARCDILKSTGTCAKAGSPHLIRKR
jgi:Fur family transcriptional regulator, ferric uptake regulator